jgi:crotonobetainyl-CoA:carnitine CoA-transferase CaiB-like acyl-CoA transferase
MDEVFKDPQVLHWNMPVEVDHPKAGKIKLAGIPVKYSDAKAVIRMPILEMRQQTLFARTQTLFARLLPLLNDGRPS